MSNSSNKPPTDAAQPLPDWRQEPPQAPRLDETREIILRLGALESQVGDLCEMARPGAGKADDEQAIEDVMAAIKRDDPTGFASLRIVKAIVDEMRDTHTKLAAQRDEARKQADFPNTENARLEALVEGLRDERDAMRQRADGAEADANRLRNERDDARIERGNARRDLRELADEIGTALRKALARAE